MMLEGFVLLLLQGTGAFVIRNPVPSRCLEASSGNDRLHLRSCNPDSELQQWPLTKDRPLSTQPPGPILLGPCNHDANTPGKQTRSPWICLDSVLPLASDSQDITPTSAELVLGEDEFSKENQRYRRASNDGDKSEGESGDGAENDPAEEQREYLRWYYRTEDPTPWKYAMLALSFVALLLGSLLFSLGIMANRNRKAIARYKSANQVLEMEKLESGIQDRGTSDTSPEGHRAAIIAIVDRDEVDRMKPGDIVLKWKDGSVSML